jgi:hypothetical protein
LSGGSGRIAAPVVGKGSGRDARAPVRPAARVPGPVRAMSKATTAPAGAGADDEWEEF